ncbi:ribbon-helix-helix protein, CopG family [Frigoriflavimonas asaccharolytica]|uniref:Ribbon-helix-helix protein CopG domain-containing protein n=1 Tax=Frigoriflavimonas asaccharolytica TaxID=2735899 RepID=A0A8J8K750_9FLAO|nr:ribbon-helix-helix protein, CopG family [Frigoriflavimonas asaccharolytica]NRS91141.1 hypothetical protein [Frigoriflavimonas asaccharolytica]
MVQEKKLTSIRLGKNLYAELKKKAKQENRSVNNYIETALMQSLDFYEPNEETIAAMEEVEEMTKNGTGESFTVVRKMLEKLRDED